MLRKTKLYSLLLVIVFSTVVGLFGFSGTAYAQEATLSSDSSTLTYDEAEYKMVPSSENSRYGYDDLAVLFVNGDPTDTANQPVRVLQMAKPQYDAVNKGEEVSAYYDEYICNESGECEIQGEDSVEVRVAGRTPDDCPPEGCTAFEDAIASTEGEQDTGERTCRVDGIGWMICPIVNFMAGLVDSSYWILDRVLLRTAPITIGDPEDPLYKSWKMMRDFANVIFVIGFLFIVFSQVSSVGVSNYGIKRLLPKLIISAILVNISYFICALAVDVSNILGSSLKDLLDGLAESTTMDGNAMSDGGGFSGFMGWSAIASIVIVSVVTGPGWMAVLGLLGVLLFSVLGVIAATVVTLILRQVLIILLVVISPLAFVALLLPNTEEYFKKWRSLFQILLLLYPIIAIVFGASALASRIIMASAEAAPADGVVDQTLGGVTQTLLQLAGAAASILPLAIVPTLMKLGGGVLNRFAGIVNDPTKGLIDSRRNALSERSALQAKVHKTRRKGDSIEKVGKWVGSDRGSKFFGESNSKRRRFITSATHYGERVAQEELKAAESDSEKKFLETAGGEEAVATAKNAQQRLQTAQINAETVRIDSVEGINLQQDQVLAETRKQTAEDRAQTEALNNIAASTEGQRALGQAEMAGVNKQAAEDSAKSVGLSHMATSPEGRAALGGAKSAELEKKTYEDQAQTAALSGVSGAIATGVKQAEIEKRTAENRVQTMGTRGVSTAAAAAEKTAELEKQTAENRLASSAAQQVSRGTRRAAYESGLEKESIENRKEAAAIRTADNNLKVQSEASAELLNAAKGEVKQIYEEAVAGSPPAGVSGGSVAQAQAARRDSNVTGGATDSAKRVSQQDFSQRVLSDSSLAAEIGGIDPHGKTRAKARAASTITGAFEEAVSNEKKTMSTTAPEELDRIMRDVTQSTERRAAAASTLVKTGSTDAVLETINYLGEAKRRNEANIGDIQQQVIADIGNRKPTAVGATAVAALGRGEFDGTMDELIRGRIVAGKVNASTIANMPVEEIDHMIDVVNRSASLRARPEFAALQAQIREYLTNTQLKGQQPASEIISRMKTIAP